MMAAQVNRVNAASRTLDVTLLHTNQPIAGVLIASGTVASDSGLWDVPSSPPSTSPSQIGVLRQGLRNVIALVEEVMPGCYVALGFLHPAGGQMAFTQDDRVVRRHPSGAYVTMAPDGSMEAWHPSGTFIRIGTGGHEDVGQFAADGAWSSPAAVGATITVSNGNFVATIAPDGTTTIKTPAPVTVSYQHMTLNGNVQLNGNLSIWGTMTAIGGDGVSDTNFQITGNVKVTGSVTSGGDQVAGDVSQIGHVHIDAGGSGNSGPPLGGS